jgi:hypothetical protein
MCHRQAESPAEAIPISAYTRSFVHVLNMCALVRLAVLQRKADNKEQEEKDRQFQVGKNSYIANKTTLCPQSLCPGVNSSCSYTL